MWLYVALLGNFKGMSRLEIIFESALYFLSPAIIVELIRYGYNQNNSEKKVKSNNKLLAACQQLNVNSIILLFFWAFFIVFMSVYGKDDIFSIGGIELAILCYLSVSLTFFVPIAVIEYMKNPVLIERKKNKQLKALEDSKREISDQEIAQYIRKSMIRSVACVGILVLWGILAFCIDNELAVFLVFLCAVTAVICIFVSGYNPKIKAKIKERQKAESAHRAEQRKHEKWLKSLKTYKGVYLTGEQIYQIENKISLPIVHTSMYLEYDEVAVYHSVATRQEMKKKVVGRTGGYWGGTIRVTKRFSIHTGSSSGTPVYGEVPVSYEGDLIITNKRLVFWSAQKGFSFLHHEVCNATPNASGFWFITGKGIYTLSVPKAELALNVLSAVRNGTIPIEGWEVENQEAIQVGNDICKEESNDTFQENINEIEKNDISSIDGMNGHEFEYFCADILRKNGFSEVNVTKGSGDQGVDILAVKDGVKYAIQCKNYASALSNTPVQEVNAGKTFYNCHVGVVMTNSTFTQGAEALAQATGVLLWNREVLQKMMGVTE